MCDGCRDVLVPLLPRRRGQHRREAPVLPAREAAVGRRPHRHPAREERLPAPGVEAVGVHAHREVETQAAAVLVEAAAELVELAAYHGLRHQVEALLVGLHVLVVQHAVPGPGGPVAPVAAQAGLGAAEAGVATELGIGALGRGEAGQRGAHLGVSRGHVEHGRRRRWRVPVPEVQDQLRPEQPAHRAVGARLGGRGVEGGEEREHGDEVAAALAEPAAEGLEVAQVADGAAAAGAERRQLGAHPPAPVRARALPRLDRRGDDGAARVPPSRLHHQGVIARRQRAGDVDGAAVVVQPPVASGFQRERGVRPGLARHPLRGALAIPGHEDGRREVGGPGGERAQRSLGLPRVTDGRTE